MYYYLFYDYKGKHLCKFRTEKSVFSYVKKLIKEYKIDYDFSYVIIKGFPIIYDYFLINEV